MASAHPFGSSSSISSVLVSSSLPLPSDLPSAASNACVSQNQSLVFHAHLPSKQRRKNKTSFVTNIFERRRKNVCFVEALVEDVFSVLFLRDAFPCASQSHGRRPNHSIVVDRRCANIHPQRSAFVTSARTRIFFLASCKWIVERCFLFMNAWIRTCACAVHRFLFRVRLV